MTTTQVRGYTYTQTATYLSGLIMGAISDLLAALGINRSSLYAEWEQDENAIAAWIEERALALVALECVQPNGTVAPVFEFAIRYDVDGGRFVERQAALARYQAKLEAMPRGTTFRLFCSFRGPHSDQPGWGPGSRSSTAGLRCRSFGTLGEAPHAAADLHMYR